MKCPECNHQQKYASGGMTCGKCGYAYVLNPETDAFADGKMKHLIHRASYGGTKHYTINMLHSNWLSGDVMSVGYLFAVITFLSLFVSTLFTAFVSGGTGTWLMIFVLLWGSLLGFSRLIRPRHKKEALMKALSKWIGAGKDFGNLLESPSLHSAPKGWTEPDIYDYGAEKILIVDRDILVDLFVLNGYHAESSTMIISSTGYPSYIAPLAKRLIEEKPEIPVLFLHDADCSFSEVQSRAITAMPFLETADQKIDVGIGPKTLRVLPGIKKAVTPKLAENAPVDLIPYLSLAAGISLSAETGESLETIFANPKNFDHEASVTSFG
ncbi:MAG: hypothetical protein ACSHYA_12865 [Opitutaceae bacterium]